MLVGAFGIRVFGGVGSSFRVSRFWGLEILGFQCYGLGFRVLGVSGLGFRGLGFRGLGVWV